MKKYTVTGIVAAILLWAAFVQPASGATTNVVVGFVGDHFSPTNVFISSGDSVIWTWAGTFHSTTSGTNGAPGDDNGVPGGLWDSGVITTTPHTFTNQFTSAGVYKYYCSVHFSLGMTGQVFVASSSFATNVLVGSGGFHFTPINVLISVNNSVIWTWAGITHTTTSGTNGIPGDDNGVPSGLWDSGVNNTGHTFTNTFTSAGTFSYFCSVHYTVGMTGQVFVVSSGVPPTLSITNPSSGAVFAAPANVTIGAGVTNGSGTIANVQFLQGTTVLANETTGPFTTTANSLAAGSYTLTAIAQDNDGFSATNSVNISVVTPVTVSLTNVFVLSKTNFQFNYPANIGLNYVVQRSTNLINWTSLVTNMASSNPVVFVDSQATNGLNFYRVGRMPNP